jgi:hypothetical protein
MENPSIALHLKNQDLSSSADFNKGLENQSHSHSPLTSIIDIIKEATEQRERKKREEREKLRQQQLADIRQAYDWKLKKADNLKLALLILTNQKHKVELIPNFDLEAFIEAVDENLDYKERWLLADLVYEMYVELNNKINKINSYDDDTDLFYKYHTHNPNEENGLVTADHNGQPVYHYGADEPTSELVEMEATRDILMNLSDELNGVATIQPISEALENLKLALAV